MQEQGIGRYKNGLSGNWLPDIHVKETQTKVLACRCIKDDKEKYCCKCKVRFYSTFVSFSIFILYSEKELINHLTKCTAPFLQACKKKNASNPEVSSLPLPGKREGRDA